MKQLVLLRHGEAGFSNSVDFQRQLTSRGKSSLQKLGEILAQKGLEIDLLYCSPATRTQETAQIIKQFIPVKEEILSHDIYDGHLGDLINLLEKTGEPVQTCMVIGHNPTISLLLSHLSEGNYIGLPPGALGIVELEINDWMMIGQGSGKLLELLE